jgi:nitrogen regulatory protein PII
MKMISSVIRPARLDAVKLALHDMNVVALTIVEVRDYDPQPRPTVAWMGSIQTQQFTIKFEIRVVVHDDDADGVVGLVMRAASTRRIGDGYVCVMPIEHRYSICSGLREV